MRNAAFFVFLLLLLSPATISAETPNWSQPVFGVVDASVRPAEAAQLGVEWERLPFYWNLFQPSGPNDFNADAISNDALASAQAAGRQVVGLIMGTPHWASDGRLTSSVPSELDLPIDNPDNYFANFVTKLVSHYSQQGIHHWIIWNEPDIRPGEGHVEFEGELEDYYLMLKSAYLAAHAADPNVHIQMAGLSWWYDSGHGREPYLLRLLQRVAQDPEAAQHNWYFDGITVHIYFTTSTVPYILELDRNILSQFGLLGKEIWLAEFNASPRRDPNTPINAPFNLSLEQQADFIVQASALALAAGADRIAVYKMYDSDFVPGQTEPWGLVRADGSLRPAFTAYQRVISNFNGARSIQRYSSGVATMVTLQGGGRTTQVMWNDTFDAGEFLIYGGGNINITDSVGNSLAESMTVSQGAAVISAPGAEQVDMPYVVVAGAVRVVTGGGLRTVVFRAADGTVTTVGP